MVPAGTWSEYAFIKLHICFEQTQTSTTSW